MFISSNTTGMLAGVTAFTDKDGRDHALVVVKGTFLVARDGSVALAEEQAKFAYADEHYGEPSETSIKYECDFAPAKPAAEVMLCGSAFAPGGKAVTELDVSIEVGSWKKQLRVTGDRKWEAGLLGSFATAPEPFVQMPLVYERAFGGWDRNHASETRHTVERRNLVGVGFQTEYHPAQIVGKPLPNIEYPGQRITKWNDKISPAGFGVISRCWLPRAGYAGTYDQAWLDAKCPFLPDDFDHRYFQSTPLDQQIPGLAGGEEVHCTNLSPEGILSFELPRLEVPILFRFRDREVETSPTPDTLLLEPSQRRFQLTWRSLVPVGRKYASLRDVLVGQQPKARPRPGTRKRRFESLADLVRWKKSIA